MKDYNTILTRVEAAKTELDVARAAATYTYSIGEPATVPKKPKKPNLPLIVVGGIIGSVLLALFLSGARDLASGVFFETWQVERRLKLPVLGELPPP